MQVVQETCKNEFGNDLPFIDPQILSRIRFVQANERKNWQGVNVQHSGIPGTTTLNFKETPMTFALERENLEACEKVVYVLRQLHEAIVQVNMTPLKEAPSNMKDEDWIFTNENFIQFRFFELIKGLQSGHFVYDDALMKKINAAVVNPKAADIFLQPNRNSQCLYKMLKCESKLVRFLFELNGLANTERHDWNALWTHTTGKSYFYERLNQFQKLNHFPMSIELTRKDNMATNIQRMQHKFSKHYFNFIPETFCLPDQFNQFVDCFKTTEAKLKAQVLTSSGQMQVSGHRPLRHNMWIVKPANASRGIGIYLASSIDQVSVHEPQVISRYIDNPLLLYGHKFDLRLYVVITSFDPLRIYIYREGLVRFASEVYDTPNDPGSDQAKFSHLTNYSINKNNQKYVQNQDADDDNCGFKWSLSALQGRFEKEGIDVNLMWAKIYDLLIKSILSIEEVTKASIKKSNVHRNNCFELFGYDVMLDANLTPWLIEVNLSPSLQTDSPLDLKIKTSLIKDCFTLVGIRKPAGETTPVSNEYFSNLGEINDKDQLARRLNGKLPKKTTQSSNQSRQDAVVQDIFAQLRKSELNWVQREYLSTFVQLGTRAREVVIESLLEHQRRTNFVRIYPVKNSDQYDCFISTNRQMQQTLYTFLYQEAYTSFKDVKTYTKIFSLEKYFARHGAAKERIESKPVKGEETVQVQTNVARHKKKQEEWREQEKEAQLVLEQKQIAREILGEYLFRMSKLLRDTGMVKGKLIQTIRDETHKLCKVPLLQSDDYPVETTDSGGDTHRSGDPPKKDTVNVENGKVVRKLERKLIQLSGGTLLQMKAVKEGSGQALVEELRLKSRTSEPTKKTRVLTEQSKVQSTIKLLSQYQDSFLTDSVHKHAKKFLNTKELMFFPTKAENENELKKSYLEFLVSLKQKVELMNSGLRASVVLSEDDVLNFRSDRNYLPQIASMNQNHRRANSSRQNSHRTRSGVANRTKEEPQVYSSKNLGSLQQIPKPQHIRRSTRNVDEGIRKKALVSASGVINVHTKDRTFDAVFKQVQTELRELSKNHKSKNRHTENPNEPDDDIDQESNAQGRRLKNQRVNSQTVLKPDFVASQTMSFKEKESKYKQVDFSLQHRKSFQKPTNYNGAVAYLTKTKQAQLKAVTNLGVPFDEAFIQVNRGLISEEAFFNVARSSPKRKLSPIQFNNKSGNVKKPPLTKKSQYK